MPLPQYGSVATQVAGGKADFGLGSSDQVLEWNSNGLPLVAVAATMQHDPQAVMVHKNSPIHDFKDLEGHTPIPLRPRSSAGFSLPDICPPLALARLLAAWDPARRLVFCDEDAGAGNPVAVLADVARAPLAVLIGPEGGFAEDERAALLKVPNVVRLSLGPRILRGDTAAVAALALVQAVIGDWR